MTKILFSLGVLAALSGCSTFSKPAYECELPDSPQGKCASMEQAYAAVKRMDPNSHTTSVFDTRAAKHETDKPFFQGREAEMPPTGQQGTPVFSQPKVHRVWVAPYVDADGNLRTGEYTYFNTAGKWNYGTTRAPGAASGAFGPGKPDNLGFVPSIQADKKPTATPAAAAPAKPTTPGQAPANVHPAKPGDTSITQPYQKLND